MQIRKGAPLLYKTLVNDFVEPENQRRLFLRRWGRVTDQVMPMTMKSATMSDTRDAMSTERGGQHSVPFTYPTRTLALTTATISSV